MRNNIDISLARFLMLLSMVLLGVLEYLWLHNEFKNKYRDMEDKINHVLFTNIRDVEDSLIFSRLASGPFTVTKDGEQVSVKILMEGHDSMKVDPNCTFDRKIMRADVNVNMRHRPARGLFLEKLTSDTTGCDSGMASLSTLVMHHIRMSDSTGEYSGYNIISWQGEDTMLAGLASKPQFDVLAGKNMALTHQHYRADIFHDLLPHISFAFFLWVMVGTAFYYIWKNLRRQMQLNALRDEFVSNITHELKTPITTVGVALESLHMSQELKSGQSRRYLDICQAELKRLSLLVERILNNRAPQIQYEKMDMRQVVEDVMQSMKVQFDNKRATVRIQQEGDNFIINGDKAHMSGVLYNLLENALKYSTGNPEIRVHLSRDGESVRLAVEDNGIGIDPGFHDKIFEKLFRVPHEDRHDVKGHGLGLSYVADVVKKHEGKIDLVSQPGHGSVFSLTLPAWHDTPSELSHHLN